MDASQVYTFADPFVFERLRYATDDGSYSKELLALIPSEWETRRTDIWLEAHPPLRLFPFQGFKLHLSVETERALELLRVIVPYLVEGAISFKIIGSSSLHGLINSKRYPRPACGKFATIYPPNHEAFLRIALNLKRLTVGFVGPYILSDRRLGTDGIVFYRYGAFREMAAIRRDGTRELLIKYGPNGETAVDDRLPYYQLPPDINEPFPDADPNDDPNQSTLVNGRYDIQEALAFSSTGGVYRGSDTHTGAAVVLKEARPYILTLPSVVIKRTATASLVHETNALQRLQSVTSVPRYIESFVEWEHTFLVESFEPGIPLASLRAQSDFIFLEQMADVVRLRRSASTWRNIALNLLSSIREIHALGMVIGDISPVNILYDRITGNMTLIDLEAAHAFESTGSQVVFGTKWAFPGFRKKQNSLAVTPSDDLYAIGMTLYNLICPVHNLFELSAEVRPMSFLEHFVDAGLPAEMLHIVEACCEGDSQKATQIAEAFAPDALINERSLRQLPNLLERCSTEEVDWIDVCRKLACDIEAAKDTTREDRLWPADAMVFQTNPLALSHGASGIASYLYHVNGSLADDVLLWLDRRSKNLSEVPSGWSAGIAGIAWSFAEIGWRNRAIELIRTIPTSPNAYASADFYDGVAGWGTAALAVAERTQSDEASAIASQAESYLLSAAVHTQDGVRWPNQDDGAVKLGFGLGNAGIATFLLRSWQKTKNEEALQLAVHALDYEISFGQKAGEALLWGPTSDSSLTSPYWLRGSGGVASALIRFYAVLGEKRYLQLAIQASKPACGFFSVAPHLFEGLAAMGETLLDMYWITGDPHYLSQAKLKAHQVMLFAIPTRAGIRMPGRFLFRSSCDYATGSAGVGTFLLRLQNSGRRQFIDPF